MGAESVVGLLEPPLVAAGVLGGPAVQFLVTPARNASTLGAQNATLSLGGVVGQVFRSGFVSGWRGGVYPAVAAAPQFLMLGPVYHGVSWFAGSAPAVAAVAGLETAVTFGAESKNGQLAFNQNQLGGPPSQRKPLIPAHKMWNPAVPYGPGVGWMLARNLIATSGLRIINEPYINAFRSTFGKSTTVDFFGDLWSNVTGACLSMPCNQLFAYTATSPHLWNMDTKEYLKECKSYLGRQYFTESGRISGTIVRDLGLRSLYMAGAYTMFATIEKACVRHWPY